MGYLVAVGFVFISMLFLTVTLSGAAVNAARGSAQLAVCLVLLLRLLYAVKCGEQSKTWVYYIAGMIVAAPIWILIEPIIFAFAGY